MSKKEMTSALEALEAQALEFTKSNISKGRAAKTGTYLEMLIGLIEGGEEVALTRTQIIAKMSVRIAVEQNPEFSFSNPEDVEAFVAINKKVKAQVAAALSNSNNNTSLSYNPTTKDKYELVRVETAEGTKYHIVLK